METQYNPDQTLQADLRQYIALLWQWAWLIILATLLAGIAAFVTSNLMEPVYQAKTTLLINEAPGAQTSDYTALLTSERLARTYSEMLTKRPVIDEVIQRLDLDLEIEDRESFKEAIEVQLVRDTQLIELSVEDTDTEQAALVANTIIDVFAEQNQALQASRFAESKANLEEQLER
ncbi:MAG: Wzz/FepE/Etk N-terminal domain-containing protein, partial [Chloroflexota bacterium]|nr:Wzz/FepE/Etk N-terminal domain-containing protein [Chloroflexota bacterium]